VVHIALIQCFSFIFLYSSICPHYFSFFIVYYGKVSFRGPVLSIYLTFLFPINLTLLKLCLNLCLACNFIFAVFMSPLLFKLHVFVLYKLCVIVNVGLDFL